MARFVGIAALSTALAVSSVAADSYFFAAEAPDYNNVAIANLLENVNDLRAPGEAYAVFDWDNTCTFGDLSYTTLYYQVSNLIMRFAPEEFEEIFSMGYNATNGDPCFINGTNTVIGQDVNGTDVTFAKAIEETKKDYEVLYDAYIGPTYNLTNTSATATLDEIKETVEYINFRGKIAFLLYALWRDGGDPYSKCAMRVGMSELTLLSVRMPEAEVSEMARASIRWNLAQDFEDLTFASTGDFVVEGPFYKGLRVFNGQESIMRALRAAGVEVYIVSASPELYVREAGSILGLGYMIPKDNFYAVRFKTDEAGLFTPVLEDNYPITWGPGKGTIVETILKPMHNGSAPIYGSGDSDGDCEMLSTVRGGIIDVINRLQDNSTCINAFYQKACEYFNTTEPSTNNTYLLQGQDQTIGSWITSGFTTTDGVSYKSGVTAYDGCAAYQFLEV